MSTSFKSFHSNLLRKGFTLIELLVVIAIIAILAAILFPVFGRARENARRTTCQSNLKQMGLAITQYAQDYDETYPLVWTNETNGWGSWDALIVPYTTIKSSFSATPGGVPLLQCPSDTYKRTSGSPRSYAMAGTSRGQIKPTSTNEAEYPAGSSGSGDLGFAGKTMVGAGGKMFHSGHKVAEIPASANTLMVVEVVGANRPSYRGDAVCYRPFQPANCVTGDVANGDTAEGTCGQEHALSASDKKASHLEGWNYLFVDGHVKWLRPEKTIGASVAAGNWRSYADNVNKPQINMKGMWSLDPDD